MNSVFILKLFLQCFILKGLQDDIIVSLEVFSIVKKGIRINKQARMPKGVLVFLVILKRVRNLRSIVIIVRIILIIFVIVVIIV